MNGGVAAFPPMISPLREQVGGFVGDAVGDEVVGEADGDAVGHVLAVNIQSVPAFCSEFISIRTECTPVSIPIIWITPF